MVSSDDSFRSSGRTAAHENYRRIVGTSAQISRRYSMLSGYKLGKSFVAFTKIDAIAFFLLPKKSVGEPQLEREILLDVRRDDSSDSCARLHGFQLIVRAIQ